MTRPAPYTIGALVALLIAAPAAAQEPQAAAIARGVEYLKRSGTSAGAGEAGIAALAMIKAEVDPSDPQLAACLDKTAPLFANSSFTPTLPGGADIYEAAVIAIAFANIEKTPYKARIEAIARFLASRQNPNGSWDYSGRNVGDCSISQYAVLGLWESENSGAKVQGRIYDQAARFYLSVQSANGGWTYHPDDPTRRETVSMTAAGIGSLLICQRQLGRFRRGAGEVPNPYLVPLVSDPTIQPLQKYTPKTTDAEINAAVRRGLAWLGANLATKDATTFGPSTFYTFYGIERVGALADRDLMGGLPWFEQGLRVILPAQRADGGWSSQFGDIPNTAWSVLFLTRATAKTIRKIDVKRLKGGTLLGGRGLPDNIDNLTIAQGRVVVRPMNGAVEDLLHVVADPRAVDSEMALAGLVDRYRTEGPKALRPQKDRFRKLLEDRDAGVRRVACWGLGRSGDLDVAPDLIGVLTRDADDAVVGEARIGLQVLSRKIDGLGPAPGAPPAERAEAARRWRAWYDLARPPDRGEDDEFDAPPPAAGVAR